MGTHVKSTQAPGDWWSQAGSNRRPLQCHCSALPAELWPREKAATVFQTLGYCQATATVHRLEHAALRERLSKRGAIGWRANAGRSRRAATLLWQLAQD